jgi:hypothetical protein
MAAQTNIGFPLSTNYSRAREGNRLLRNWPTAQKIITTKKPKVNRPGVTLSR